MLILNHATWVSIWVVTTVILLFSCILPNFLVKSFHSPVTSQNISASLKMLMTKEINIFENPVPNSCPLCMKKEMKLIIIVNGMDCGALLPGLKMNSVTHVVAILPWAACLLYLSFPTCRMEIVKVGVTYLMGLLGN